MNVAGSANTQVSDINLLAPFPPTCLSGILTTLSP